MLKQFEQNSLRSGDLFSAEEAKQKISFLKEKQQKSKQDYYLLKNKQNKEIAQKQSEVEIQEFLNIWQDKIRELMNNLHRIQEKLKNEHKLELQQMQQKLDKYEIPRVKFSSKILKLRNNFQKLIKSREYIEAEYVKHQLTTLQMIETEKWNMMYQQKKKKFYEQILKKQEMEMKALKTKIKTMLNQKIKEKQDKFSILMKRQQKRKVEAAKFGPELKSIQSKQKRLRILSSKNLFTTNSKSIQKQRRPLESLNRSKQRIQIHNF